MPSFCAGYLEGDLLFRIDGLKGERHPVPSFVANSFAVLTRGAPTRPSPRLLTLMLQGLGSYQEEWEKLASNPLHLIGDRVPLWHQTVRGNEKTYYNPALSFLENILPTAMPEIAFIQKLLVPEFPLFSQLTAPSGLVAGPNDEKVDFYLPQADLVIEIDGSQHCEEPQRSKDLQRDLFLERFGIVTLRLRTKDLEERNAKFERFCDRLQKLCKSSPRLQPYLIASNTFVHRRASLRYDITASIRLQVAVMIAISHRMLDPEAPEWMLHVSQDFYPSDNTQWAKVALDELLDWFGLFARLNSVNFKAPNVNFVENGLHIDMRLFDRPDDKTLPPDVITVRTSPVQDIPFADGSSSPRKIVRVQDLGVSHLSASDVPDFVAKPPNPSDLAELSYRVFGHQNFRPGQETLILNALSGQKSLGLMPTGGGKSLCFQVPALLQTGTTFTIVPIKALGRDHCAELNAAGFTGRVVNIDSDMPATLRDKVFAPRIMRGEMRFVFVSPERFQDKGFRSLVTQLKENKQLAMFVIDEVHCLSEWGHDFRPSYLTLPGTLRNIAEDVPVLGLTATASVNVLKDIQTEFEIPDELVAYEMHRSRSELHFTIKESLSTTDRIAEEVSHIIQKVEGEHPPAIHIFSRYSDHDEMGVERYANMIANAGLGLRVGSFSGSEPKKTFALEQAHSRLRASSFPQPENFESYKKLVQELWKSGSLDVIVTTKSFGMGINKSDVRHTLHAGMPGSMEAFYQEAGRAGRDRQDAFCDMLLRREPDDITRVYEDLLYQNRQNKLTVERIKAAREKDIDGGKIASSGDFRAQLFFLSDNLINASDEALLVEHLRELLESREGSQALVRAHDLPAFGRKRLQLTLYRLYQMGMIKPWTVTDWGRHEDVVQECEVIKSPTAFDEACRAVAKRIQAVDGKAADLSSIYGLVSLPKAKPDWPALIKHLVEWARRKHLDSRLQSAWNLYSKCAAFQPEKADVFRQELEAFFKVDNNAFQLTALRDLSIQEVVPALELLITAVSEGDIDVPTALRRLSVQLGRLLEGTQESPGLNLGAAVLSLMVEDRSATEARMRFDAAIPEGALAFWLQQGGSLLNHVASANRVACEVIGEWLAQETSDRQTLLEIYDTIPAKAVEQALLDRFATELSQAI